MLEVGFTLCIIPRQSERCKNKRVKNRLQTSEFKLQNMELDERLVMNVLTKKYIEEIPAESSTGIHIVIIWNTATEKYHWNREESRGQVRQTCRLSARGHP